MIGAARAVTCRVPVRRRWLKPLHHSYVSARYIDEDTRIQTECANTPSSGCRAGCRSVGFSLPTTGRDRPGPARTGASARQSRRTISDCATTLARVPQQRQVIDYALARRATLAGLARGQLSRSEVCDAHPDLVRAARYHGEATRVRCPICRKDPLTRVTYAYGDELQHTSGRARSSRSLEGLAQRFARVRIYVVEVCRSCGWNHLCVSYLIGTAADESEPSPGSDYPDAVPVSRNDPPADDPPARTTRGRSSSGGSGPNGTRASRGQRDGQRRTARR